MTQRSGTETCFNVSLRAVRSSNVSGGLTNKSSRPAAHDTNSDARQTMGGTSVQHRLSLWERGQPLPRATLEQHDGYLRLRRQAGARIAAWLDEGKRQGSVVRSVPTPLLVRLIMQWGSAGLHGIARASGVREADVADAVVRVTLGGVRGD
ncbi:MAG TPA: hypothetical protein VJO52_04460 [Gemmatimonadaceae bacterium]|nr:hypothetical protein [Gemmatimonadaceae bacterium]